VVNESFSHLLCEIGDPEGRSILHFDMKGDKYLAIGFEGGLVRTYDFENSMEPLVA